MKLEWYLKNRNSEIKKARTFYKENRLTILKRKKKKYALMPSEEKERLLNSKRKAVQDKECVECKVIFTPSSNRQKMCSKACREYSYKNKHDKTCSTCCIDFVSTRISKKYCSKQCRVKNPQNIIKDSIRTRTYAVLKQTRKDICSIEYFGIKLEELKVHLESQFQEGMTWDNHGKWHIDHIKPLASFDLSNREELLKACNYTNLQPLWAEDNLKKGARVEIR